jgi:hypothetical protein
MNENQPKSEFEQRWASLSELEQALCGLLTMEHSQWENGETERALQVMWGLTPADYQGLISKSFVVKFTKADSVERYRLYSQGFHDFVLSQKPKTNPS